MQRHARAHGPLVLLALGASGLLLLPLLGPGCGGGSGEPEPCTLLPLPTAGPAKVDARQVEIEVRFVTMPETVADTLGFDWLPLGHAVAESGFLSYGTPDDPLDLVVPGAVVGGPPDFPRLVQPEHPLGAPVPAVREGGLDLLTDVAVHPFLPGPGCLNFDPSVTDAALGLDRVLARPVLDPVPLSADFALAGARLTDLQLEAFLTALEADADSRLFSAPRLTVYNGQRASLMLRNRLQERLDFVSAFETEIRELAPTTDTAVTGPVFDITTWRSEAWVQLEIRPALAATVLAPDRFDVGLSTETGQAEVALLQPRDTLVRIEVPFPTTTLLAGVLRDGDTQARYGLDVLQDIPVLTGRERPASRIRDGEPLLILVSAHPVGDAE